MKIAKRAEIKNLQDYETSVEVKDEGQTTVGSRWVITEKEQHDGQKQKCKARLVARGFQESLIALQLQRNPSNSSWLSLPILDSNWPRWTSVLPFSRVKSWTEMSMSSLLLTSRNLESCGG